LAAQPKFFIPSLYFIEGLPFTIVKTMSVLLFASLGASNDFIGFFTNLLYFPWTFKLFWAPLVDVVGTRKKWIVITQLVLAVLAAALSAALFAPNNLTVLLVVFALMAFTSATQDISIDGYYLDVLTKEQQAFYVGVRGAAYKGAWVFGSGALVYLAGQVTEHWQRGQAVEFGWMCAFLCCAAVFAVFACVHQMVLPPGTIAKTASDPDSKNLLVEFPRVFLDYINQPHIAVILAYVLTLRLGDALLLSMAPVFLVKPLAEGGLALSQSEVGILYGTVGTIFLFAGGIIGGAVISKGGLRKYILPFAILQNLALPLYWVLALIKPNIFVVAGVNAFEQFSYGLGTSAYYVFLLSTVKAENKAAHYAIVTAFMALGMMVPGMISGRLTTMMGYGNFFLLSFFLSLPGIITIPFLPVEQLAARRSAD
jgi:MFS transporter, PAT family, beta-lactamase induction signal transducer AmpG